VPYRTALEGLGETMTKPDNLPPRVLLKHPQISVVGAKKAVILNYSYLLKDLPAFFALSAALPKAIGCPVLSRKNVAA
jgi:hypothetical protein